MADCAHLRARGGWSEDACLGRCSFPIGPRNTWSNAAYVLAGVVVVLLDRTLAGWVMAGSLVMLGLGSGLYHGFKTLWANRLDHVGMYLTFGALAVHASAPRHPVTPWLMLVTGVALAVLLSYVIPRVSLDLQMGMLLWFSMIPAVLLGSASLALLSFGVFLAAYLCWQLDKHRALLRLWGHALWHILTAAAIAMMYLAAKGGTHA
ncbi:MAG: hypothetical protein AB7P61_07600 [Gemmatimonadales bacterium]